MNRSQAVPVIVALVAIVALGIAATTLETALTTAPDEEIDPNWDLLPIGQSEATSIKEEIAASATSGDQTESTTGQTESTAEQAAMTANQTNSTANFSTDSEERGSISQLTSDPPPEPEPEPPEPALYDQLLDLVSALLDSVVTLTVLAGMAMFGYHHRSALRSAFRHQQSDEPPAEPETTAWPETEPTNVVDRAWLRLVQTLELDHPETTTPAECLQQARNQGVDTEAAEAITTAFERVQYGGSPVDDETDRAEEALDQLTGGAR